MIKPIKGLATAFGAIPLLIIPMLAYALLGWFAPIDDYENFAFSVALVSGATTYLTAGHCILIIAAAVLTLEIAKSADTGTKGLIDAALSIGLFCFAWLAYVAIAPFGSATWLILCCLQTADAIGGGSVAIQAARRDFGAGT